MRIRLTVLVALALVGNTLVALSGYSVEMRNSAAAGAPLIPTRHVDGLNLSMPEPASLLLLGAGLTVMGTMIRRRRTQSSNA